MKFLLTTLVTLTIFLSSCGGECDVSTVRGAANCLCELTDESVIIDINDKEKLQEFTEKSQKVNDKITQSIKDGNFTAEELALEAGDRGCM